MFTHLHLHTDYSLLDSVIQLYPLFDKLTAQGFKACAITDHGNMYAANKFYGGLSKAGIKPIIGCEIYVSPRSMFSKQYGIDNKYNHLILLAKNLEGYKNLIKLVSKSHIEGFYYKPRVDFDTIKEYSKGLICSTACLQGVVSKPIMDNNEKLAIENLEKYYELFKEDFYIELQRNGLEIQEKVNDKLIEYSKKYSIPVIATCDSHFINKEDSVLQEILWCIRDSKTLDDPSRMKLESQEFYVKSEEEMVELFKDIPEAIENTQVIADKVEQYNVKWGRVQPIFTDKPEDVTSGEYLRKITYENAPSKYGELTEDLKNRLDYELDLIHSKGYDDYFLIVRSFVRFCRDNGIIVGMRGSGCGSAVAYSVGITHVEPIKWELYFERFLNPERDSPPDFDIDIADERRNEVIDFAINQFGEDNVKQIGTFSKLQTRQAIRDIARVLGIDLMIADKLSKMVVIEFGKSKPIDYMLEHDKEFSAIINSSPEILQLADYVRKLNGVHRGVSTHACGIIITPEPLVEYCPIQKDAHGGGMGMTQYEMSDTEDIGLMKYDFLGLRNLSIIGKTVSMIERSKGIKVDLMSIDPHDKETYKTIQDGHTVGVFQMESEGMKRLVKELQPESLEEISYILAAYRPGPLQFIPEYIAVKKGKKEIEYLIPELEPILKVTNGVITYQEQVIRIAVDIAGYTMGAADMLRRAMGKKKMEIMDQEKVKFIDGATAHGFDKEKIEQLWERLVQFANYGFNKAHSASYAYVTYWTAYLKTHYPIEFMASILESDLEKFDRVVIDMEECKRIGIKVLPPHVNKSDFYFALEEEKNVRFGLAGIKNLGEDAAKSVVEERNENGEYLNFDDFIYRAITRKVAIKAIEYLIKAGALDHWGNRESLIATLQSLYDKYRKQISNFTEGQIDLFGNGSTKLSNIEVASVIPEAPKLSDFEKLKWEKELLGLYMTNHPLNDFDEIFKEKHVVPVAELKNRNENDFVVVGGIINKIKRITTKNNDNMAILSVEDMTGMTEIVAFPRIYEKIKDEFVQNIPILFVGRVKYREDVVSVILDKVKALDPEKHSNNFSGIIFKIRDDHTEGDISDLKQIIKDHPGDIPVKIISLQGDEVKTVVLNNKVAKCAEIEECQKKFS